MANVIDPQGLAGGDRMNQLSDEARLYWPFYYLGSNGYGRLEINYRLVVGDMFRGFKRPPSESQMISHFKEYRDKFLCFIYESNGATWGQFWVPDSKLLPRWKTAATKKSPAPPKEAYESWLKEYESQKAESRALQNFFGELPKSFGSASEELPLGIGIGIGEGIGKGNGKDYRPSGTDGFREDIAYEEFANAYRPLKDYGLNGMAPMHAYAKELGGAVNGAEVHQKILDGIARMAKSGRAKQHLPTAENFLKNKHYLDAWAPESDRPKSALGRLKEKLEAANAN